MTDPHKPEHIISSFTSKEWSDSGGKMFASCLFIVLGLVGLVLCLIFMVFIPALRNTMAVTLLTVIFSGSFTIIIFRGSAAREKKFFENLDAQINGLILELTDNPSNKLSIDQFREMITKGKRYPLPVNGITGLEISAIKSKPVADSKNAKATTTTTTIGITAVAPDYGTQSFDRMLSAITGNKE